MQIDDLPPLRDVIASHGLEAKKSLGQNFLLDLNITSKIARLAGDISGHDVLEVGPGPGGLTRGLLAAGARRVVALEKDPRCMGALAQIAAAYPGRLDVFNADALDFDIRGQLTGPVRVVANLPYNVGTELLVRWLTPKDWPAFWSSLTLMFQKEVAERIIAKPGTKAYGRLGILAQWKSSPSVVMELPPEAFTPATESPFGRRASRSLGRTTISSASGAFVVHSGYGVQSTPQDAPFEPEVCRSRY